MAQGNTQDAFCGGCGARLATDGEFCPGCGRAIRPPAQPARRGPALAVFFAFALAAGAAFYWTTQSAQPVKRAVAGSPAPAAPNDGNGLPSGHPSIELPAEIIGFLDELAKDAESKPDDLEAWSKLARARYRAALLNASYYASAVTALDRVEKLDPDNLEAIRTRGNIAYDQRDFAAAQKHFERFLKLHPGEPGVRTDLATTLLFQEQVQPAIDMYRGVIRDHPDFGQAHVNLGIALHREGDADAAKNSFDRARELAETEEQRRRIDDLIAVAEGRTPTAREVQQAQPRSATASNAGSDFQKEVDKLLLEHRIVGPKVTGIDWTAPGKARVTLNQFPMDKMPPVMRNKFKSVMNESIAELAERHKIDKPTVELVDAASDNVMDKLDGSEWVGAFDEQEYE